MSIETVLLVLESVLLFFTILLLLYSIREGRHRDRLLVEVGRATRILTREEYFLTVSDAMLDAEREVIGSITGRRPSADDDKRVRTIVGHIEKLRGQGGTVRYLVPRFPDRLHVGARYRQAGAEIRYSSSLIQDIRYLVVDRRLVVIGIPESAGDQQATRKGYGIPSEGLAAMLEESFEHAWETATGHEAYVREMLRETGASPKLLARELHVDPAELERLAAG